MSKTTIKLSIAIESSRIGYYTRGEMYITDMLFSESSNKLMDAEDLIKEVKNAIKLMKGWNMLTIRLTDDLEYTTYPKEVHSIRFTNSYGEIKFAQVDGEYHSKCYTKWNEGKISHVYENVRGFTKWANNLQLKKVANRISESV
jgi:hypothetical protein